jgi:hypothetical protein
LPELPVELGAHDDLSRSAVISDSPSTPGEDGPLTRSCPICGAIPNQHCIRLPPDLDDPKMYQSAYHTERLAPESTVSGEITRDDFTEVLGEAFHTAFRKATNCEQAHPIWTLISQMPSDDWAAVLDFVADGFDGLLHFHVPSRPGHDA